MKRNPTRPPTEAEIDAALLRAGIGVSRSAVNLLARHASAVFETNASFNLTRITTADEFIRLHIVDSLLPWSSVDFAAPAVDIGSGAGFPGIPAAIVHGGPVLLCESIGKKAAFLKCCVEDLNLDCAVFGGRAEELAARSPREARLVTARAVSSIAALVELAAPLLMTGGRLVALKGAPTDEEVTAGDAAAAVCGMRRHSQHAYTLPDGGERRRLIVYECVGKPAVQLPRRPGLAQHSPLP